MTSSPEKDPKKDLLKVLWDAFKELLGAAATILSIYLVRKLSQWLLGGELLWGFIPVEYCEDAVDVAVFARFIWRVFRSFND